MSSARERGAILFLTNNKKIDKLEIEKGYFEKRFYFWTFVPFFRPYFLKTLFSYCELNYFSMNLAGVNSTNVL